MPPRIISAFSSSSNLLLLFVNLPCFIFLNLAPEMFKFRRKFLFIVKLVSAYQPQLCTLYRDLSRHRQNINHKKYLFLVAQIYRFRCKFGLFLSIVASKIKPQQTNLAINFYLIWFCS